MGSIEDDAKASTINEASENSIGPEISIVTTLLGSFLACESHKDKTLRRE
jgi:hypothetical protein